MAQKGGVLSRQTIIPRSVGILEKSVPWHDHVIADRIPVGCKMRLSGFTLIEIFLVMGILSILAAVAIPGFSAWLPNHRLKAAARGVASDFQLAKISAIKQNKAWAVVFDTGVKPGRYFICSDDNGDGWNGPPAMGGNDVCEKAVALKSYGKRITFGHGNATTNATEGGGPFPGDNVSYSTPDNVAVFNPKGTVSNLGYVYLANSRGGCWAVGTPSTAGVVVLKKWTGSSWD